MAVPYVDARSQRQRRIVTTLWAIYEEGLGEFITGRDLDQIVGVRGANRHTAPLRIKLRRQGWEIESGHKGFRIIAWKGKTP